MLKDQPVAFFLPFLLSTLIAKESFTSNLVIGVLVQLDLRALVLVCRYELQYAVAGRSGGSDDTFANWKSAEGNTHDTWDITIQVDGFDRSIGRRHMVEDGWFTLALSRAYPKPSSLPDLWLDTEPIGWDDTWADMEAKVQKTLRESRHPQYSSWTVAVVRCDETEERGGNHWAGGCRFLEYGGFTWHLRLSPPPGDASATREDFPVVTVTKETITAKWSGDGDQMSVGTTGGAAGISTNTVPVTPSPKAPKLSSSTPTSLTVFVDTASTAGAAEIEGKKRIISDISGGIPNTDRTRERNCHVSLGLFHFPRLPCFETVWPTPLLWFRFYRLASAVRTSQAYEFEVQRHEDDGYRGDTTRWIPVLTHADDNSDAAVPLATATELSPFSSYRFRVRARHSNGLSLVSGVSEPFTTGKINVEHTKNGFTLALKQVVKGRRQMFHDGVSELSKERVHLCVLFVAPRVNLRPGTANTLAVGAYCGRDVDNSQHDGGQVVVMGTGRGSQEDWRATAEGLEAYSQHRFRVRAVNAVGAGEWSAASDWARTEGKPSTTAGVEGFEAEAIDSGDTVCSL
ncbi:unnamed protein product [Ectocarpus sp. CCAP 1310/34]|nr:unnamed protein product [Ectocarpus sp. CCAP 1310/34]